MGFLLFGILSLVAAAVLFFVQRNQHNRAFCVRMARSASVAELKTMAQEIAKEIGGGSWRDYVKVSGEIVCDRPLTAPLSQQPCVYYRMSVQREYEEQVTVRDSEGKSHQETRRSSETMSSNQQSVPFLLQDASGQIEVNLDDTSPETITVVDEFQAEQRGGLISYGGFSLAIGNSMGGRHTLGYRYNEVLLPLHRQATIVANVVDQGSRLVLQKPTEGEKHFIVSLKTAEEITKAAQEQAKILRLVMLGSIVLGIILMIISVFQS